ncbi:hypothetical protein Tco_0414557 [Tanacetum coccineum]
MLLAMKDEAGSNLTNEENDFLLDSSYGEDTLEELTATVMLMARLQLADDNTENVPSYDAKAVSEVNASSKVHEQELETCKDRVKTFESKTIQYSKYKETCKELERELRTDKNTIERIMKEKYQIQSDFFKIKNEKIIIQHETQLVKKAFKERENRYLEDIVDLEEKLSSHDRINPERLKKAIATQPKLYNGDSLHSVDLIINSPDSEETLEDAEEIRLKMRNKMKFLEQTYFSIPSTSNNGSESKEVTSELPILKMPKESRLLNMFDTMDVEINGLQTRIDKTLLEDREKRWMSDSQNSFREFYKTNVIPMSNSLYKRLKEIKEELIEEVQEMLNIFESMEKQVAKKSPKETILENEIDRLLETLGKLVCVTPFNKTLENKAKNVSDTKVPSDRSKSVTSQSTPNTEQSGKNNKNVIVRGMYKIIKQETKIPDSKANIHVSNSTGVESSNSVRRPKSKDTKSKNRVLKNTKSSSTYVWKTSSSASIDSNKCEPKDSNVCQTNACVSNSKTVNAYVNVVNDGSNIVYISCGKDVFLHIHEKYVARYALSRNSRVKRALFHSPVAAKSKNLGATSVVAKSRLSVIKTSTATNKVIQLVLWIVDSGCSKHMTGNLQLLRNFVEKFMGTVRFGNDHFAAITGYGDYVQGNLTICHVYYVEGLGHNLFLVGQFCDEDLEVAFRSNTCYVRNLEGDDLLTRSRDSNLYTISITEMAASSPSIPCSPECKIVGQILLDHPLSYALTATVNVQAVYLQQFWRTFVYTVDMFRDILHLPVETPDNPFVAPVNIKTIKAFMNRVGYQGIVDEVSAFYTKNLAQPWQTMFKVFNRCLTTRTSGHDQTKINILQMFHVVINQTNVDYAALL